MLTSYKTSRTFPCRFAVAVSVLTPIGSLLAARGGAVEGRRRDKAGRARRETERAVNTIVIDFV